jgi:hypothetical protein
MERSVWVEQVQLLLLFVVVKGGAGHGNAGQRAFKGSNGGSLLAVVWIGQSCCPEPLTPAWKAESTPDSKTCCAPTVGSALTMQPAPSTGTSTYAPSNVKTPGTW